MDRYKKNYKTISHEDQQKLSESSVCIIGSGGLGGHIFEMLGRVGVGQITIIDGDAFDETNLNRQILSTENVLGRSKVEVAKQRMAEVNSEIEVTAIHTMVTAKNAKELLHGYDLIIDGLDHIDTRLMVVDVCKELNIPFVYGAIAGWYGMVATIMPGDETLNSIYNSDMKRGGEVELGNPSFTPAAIASFEVAEAIKLLLGKGDLIRNGFLHIDMLENEHEIFRL